MFNIELLFTRVSFLKLLHVVMIRYMELLRTKCFTYGSV